MPLLFSITKKPFRWSFVDWTLRWFETTIDMPNISKSVKIHYLLKLPNHWRTKETKGKKFFYPYIKFLSVCFFWVDPLSLISYLSTSYSTLRLLIVLPMSTFRLWWRKLSLSELLNDSKFLKFLEISSCSFRWFAKTLFCFKPYRRRSPAPLRKPSSNRENYAFTSKVER